MGSKNGAAVLSAPGSFIYIYIYFFFNAVGGERSGVAVAPEPPPPPPLPELIALKAGVVRSLGIIMPR